MRDWGILGDLRGMHHEWRWVVPHVTCVVRVWFYCPWRRLLLLLLNDLLCFVAGHRYFVL